MDNAFERFPVYQKALRVGKEINILCERVRDREYYYLKDQLRRASSSIVLNLAEGSGKWTKKDKICFYRIARASAFECMGALDLFKAFKLVGEAMIDKHKQDYLEIAGNIQAMIFSIEKRK